MLDHVDGDDDNNSEFYYDNAAAAGGAADKMEAAEKTARDAAAMARQGIRGDRTKTVALPD